MKNKKNHLTKLLLIVCFAMFALPIVSILADTPDDLTDQSAYLVVHNTTDSYSTTGGPSSIVVKDADDNVISPVGNTYNDVPADASIDLEYVFHLEDGDGQGEIYSYSDSNYFTITLPEGITFDYTIGQTHDIIAEDNITGSWPLGTWQFIDNSTIRVNFNADVANHSNIWGKIDVNGTFNELGTDDDTSTEVTFGSQVITINREIPPLPEIELTKSGEYNASTNDITWTVTVTPPDGINLDDYTLVDVYSTNQSYKTGSFYVGTDNIPDINLDLATNNQVSYTFPTDTTGVQTITYKTTPTTYSYETGANSSTELSTFTNAATIYWGTEAATDPASATVTTNWVSKSGANVTTSDGSLVIKWTVNITIPGDEAVTGAMITDTLPAGLELLNNGTYPVQISINGASATNVSEGTGDGTYTYTYTDVSTASTLAYRFPSSLSENATLTYYTVVTDRDAMLNNNGTVRFTNNAKLNWNEISDSANPPGDVATVTGVGSGGLLAKTAGSTTNFIYPGYISWTITVNRNDISMTNAAIQDTIPANQKLLIDASHAFTVKQDSTTVFTTATVTATTEFTSTDSFVNNFSYALGNINGTYTVTYYTEITDFSTLYSNNNSVNFTNQVTLTRDGETNINVNGTKTYRSQMIAKTVAESYDYAEHTMKWQIVVNRNQLPLTNGIVADTLPSGMVLIIDEDHPFTVLEDGEAVALATTPTSGTNGDTTFTYEFPATIDNQYVITFYSLLTDSTLQEQWSGTRNFTNNASLDGDEIATAITASATAQINNPVVTKTYDYDTGSDYIDWCAVINPGQIELIDASVTDVLNEGLMLDEESVKLYQVSVNADGSVESAANGTLVTSGYTVDMPTEENNNTLTVSLPNSSYAYRLEFTTFIIVDDLDIVNEISLTGTTESPSGSAESGRIEINNLWSTGGSGSMALTVNKTNEEGNPIEGAVYRLLNINKDPIVKDGNYVEATTDENGDAIFSNLPTWVFYVAEVDAPDGYLLNTDYLGGDRLDENTLYTTTDEYALGTLTFDKEATDEAILSGGTFTLTGTDYDDNAVSRTASAVDGVVTFTDLPIGTYSVTETTAPDGYVESSDTITATVGYNDYETEVVVTITSENNSLVNRPLPTATVEFNKTDGINPLSGAIFGLYDSEDTLLQSATSDINGLVQFTNVGIGTYTIRETQAPEDYLLNETEITAVVTYNDENTGMDVALTPDGDFVNEIDPATQIATIQLKKTDDTGAALEGAVFGLYNGDDELVSQATSDASGMVTFADVLIGSYTIKEISAPAGYRISNIEIPVELTKEDVDTVVQTTPYTIVDNRIGATIQIKKVDSSSGKVLSGAVFSLVNENGTIIATATSGSNGLATFSDVMPGSYTITETKAPSGYLANTDKITVTTELDKTYTYTVKNTAKDTLPQSGMFWDSKMLALAGIFLILLGGAIGLLSRTRKIKKI